MAGSWLAFWSDVNLYRSDTAQMDRHWRRKKKKTTKKKNKTSSNLYHNIWLMQPWHLIGQLTCMTRNDSFVMASIDRRTSLPGFSRTSICASTAHASIDYPASNRRRIEAMRIFNQHAKHLCKGAGSVYISLLHQKLTSSPNTKRKAKTKVKKERKIYQCAQTIH
jgi:hypothetical protein